MTGATHFKGKSYEGIPNNTAASWWNDPGLRTNVYHCIGCCMCVYYLGYDQSLLNGLQSMPEWKDYFGHPAGNKLGLIAAAIFLPGIPFPVFGDWLAMRYGRRVPIWLGSILIIIGAIMNALSKSTGMFIGSRVILGAGGSITKVGAPPLLQEIAHPRIRGILGTCYYGFYYTGSTLSALMCIAGLYIPNTWSWRMPCLLQILGPIAVLAITCTAPESPRWLIKQGRHEEAKAIMTKYHANGAVDDALVEWEYREIVAVLDEEGHMKKSSWLDFFRTPGNIRRFIVLCTLGIGSNWVGNGIVSYFLSPALAQVGVTKPVQQTAINAGLAVWNLILAQLAGWNVDRIGRRPLLMISTSGMLVSYALVMAMGASFSHGKGKSYGIASIPFMFFFYGFYDIAWTPLPVSYATEIMPFSMRSKGVAVVVLTQNTSNAFNQFVNPIALAAITWKYYGVYLAADAFFLFMIWYFFPETKNLTIEEVSLIFDIGRAGGRTQAVQHIQQLTHAEESGLPIGNAGDKGEYEHKD